MGNADPEVENAPNEENDKTQIQNAAVNENEKNNKSKVVNGIASPTVASPTVISHHAPPQSGKSIVKNDRQEVKTLPDSHIETPEKKAVTSGQEAKNQELPEPIPDSDDNAQPKADLQNGRDNLKPLKKPGEDPDKEKEGVLTAAQWEELLMNHPNPENVRKFVQALSNEEIDGESYYRISQAMVTSSDPEVQYLGIYSLNGLQNLRSFSLVSKAYANLSTQSKSLAKTFLYSFSDRSRVGVISGALQSKDPTIVLHAGLVLTEGIKNSSSSNSDRPRGRGSRSNPSTTDIKVYSTLVPILQNLQSHASDARVIEMAQGLISQLESTTK